MWYIWLIAAGVFFIFEIATVGFLIFWLGIAALLAMIVSFFTDNIIIQTTIFVISSCILIPLTKPLVNKFIHNPTKPMNSFSLIGKHGIAISTINTIEGIGQIKVDGQIWSAKCEEGTVIQEGMEVEVLKIDGVKLLVSPIKSKVSV